MPVIARDAVASDHLVYAWPFPIGPEEYEVACAEDELVVMCPSWMVGDRLGPGRHRWRTPDPMRPVSAYFVLTAPVEVSFDMITQFLVPNTGQPIRLRAQGSLQVRCMDAALLVAQFVGLPFDHVNDGVLRSVSRSIERMLARLLTRRVVMAATPQAVTDPAMLQNIVEELIAYNPTAGAVFGIELVRLGHLAIMADDGSRPWQQMQNIDWSGGHQRVPPNGDGAHRPDPNLLETVRAPQPEPNLVETARRPGAAAPAAAPPQRAQTQPLAEASGEITVKPKGEKAKPEAVKDKKTTAPGHAAAPVDQTPQPHRVITTPAPLPPPPRRAGAIEVPRDEADEDATMPEYDHSVKTEPQPAIPTADAHASILGIGVSHMGASASAAPKVAPHQAQSPGPSGVTSGEISKKIAPGGRVLVAGPNGLMQSATVRQLLQGYYELEVGGSGETIWVPVNNVVPE